MNTVLKNIIFLLVAIIMVAGNSNAQEATMPVGFTPRGTNSSSIATPWENTDSVTTGSVMRYWIAPDGNAPFNTTTSTFAWTMTAALGTHTNGVNTNLDTVTFTNTPETTGTITANETSPAPSCTSSDATPISVRVIARPSITTLTVDNITCQTTINIASITVSATDITSSVIIPKGVSVNYSITGPGYSLTNQTAVFGNSTTLTIALATNITTTGRYTLTINSITDRIATKCSLTAITVTGVSANFYVTPTPTARPTKHIKNDVGW